MGSRGRGASSASSRTPMFSRRAALRGFGLASGSAFLAACGIKGTSEQGSGATGSSSASAASGTSSASADASATDQSATDASVVWSNWPEYLDVSEDNVDDHPTLDAFTAETGIRVDYVEDVNDNDQYFAKIAPILASGGTIAADMFVVSDWMIAKLIRLGYLQDIDYSAMPNLANLVPALRDTNFDPGRKKSITWQSGFTAIAYNPAVTGKPVETVDQLLTDPALKGKVSLLMEMQDTIGVTLLDMGFDSADFTDEQFDKAIAKISAAVQSGQVRQFTGNDYAQGLVSGDIGACIAYTGDVVQLQLDNPDLQYVLPEPGFLLWSDNIVIPNGARHKANAEKLIDYYYRPDVAAQVADYVNYIPPVTGTREILEEDDPDVANNPLIFPTDDDLARGREFMVLDETLESRYGAAYAQVTGA